MLRPPLRASPVGSHDHRGQSRPRSARGPVRRDRLARPRRDAAARPRRRDDRCVPAPGQHPGGRAQPDGVGRPRGWRRSACRRPVGARHVGGDRRRRGQSDQPRRDRDDLPHQGRVLRAAGDARAERAVGAAARLRHARDDAQQPPMGLRLRNHRGRSRRRDGSRRATPCSRAAIACTSTSSTTRAHASLDSWNDALEFAVRSPRGEIGQGLVELPVEFTFE